MSIFSFQNSRRRCFKIDEVWVLSFNSFIFWIGESRFYCFENSSFMDSGKSAVFVFERFFLDFSLYVVGVCRYTIDNVWDCFSKVPFSGLGKVGFFWRLFFFGYWERWGFVFHRFVVRFFKINCTEK